MNELCNLNFDNALLEVCIFYRCTRNKKKFDEL